MKHAERQAWPTCYVFSGWAVCKECTELNTDQSFIELSSLMCHQKYPESV